VRQGAIPPRPGRVGSQASEESAESAENADREAEGKAEDARNSPKVGAAMQAIRRADRWRFGAI